MTLSPATIAVGTRGTFADLDVHLWQWAALVAFITILLTVDVLAVHRTPHEIRLREATIESSIWIGIGVAFVGVIHLMGGPTQGSQAAGEYMAGFLLEKSLSVDNVFVWAAIFGYFAVPKAYQFRVLFWGIFGALLLRAAFIFAGSALIERFVVTFAVFGAILLYTAYKLTFAATTEVDPERSVVLRWVRGVIPSTGEYAGQRLLTRQNGRRVATPLLAVLILVETTDIVFAVDSVPAIFGVSREPFIVFSSNAFAILGLRALYFLLSGVHGKVRYLHYGLGAILAFVGAKMMLTFATEQTGWPSEHFHVPTIISLGVIVVTMAATVAASLIADARDSQPTARYLPDDDIPPPADHAT